MPNVNELQSIVNYENAGLDENAGLAVSIEFNTECVAGCTVDDPDNACSCTATAAPFYWSSTSWSSIPQNAWVVFFGGSGVGIAAAKSWDWSVRAVRGGLID